MKYEAYKQRVKCKEEKKLSNNLVAIKIISISLIVVVQCQYSTRGSSVLLANSGCIYSFAEWKQETYLSLGTC